MASDVERAGASLASSLRQESVVCLSGALGAGKTCFIRALCEALGVEVGFVTSPSFSIINRYQANRFSIAHADLYRLNSLAEFDLAGGLDLIGKELMLIEWPEIILSELPSDTIFVDILVAADSGARTIAIRRG